MDERRRKGNGWKKGLDKFIFGGNEKLNVCGGWKERTEGRGG